MGLFAPTARVRKRSQRLLGIARSPAYHYEPETGSCAEKFILTLTEQVLWIEHFATFEKLQAVIIAAPSCLS